MKPVLAALSPRLQAIYATMGRPSIPPERLFKTMLLQTLFSIRSERQPLEQRRHTVLFRWFVGLTPDDAVWVPTVFTKHRQRLIDGAARQGERTASTSECQSSVEPSQRTRLQRNDG